MPKQNAVTYEKRAPILTLEMFGHKTHDSRAECHRKHPRLKAAIWRQSKGQLPGESRLLAVLSKGNASIFHITSLAEIFHAASSEINMCSESTCSPQPRVN